VDAHAARGSPKRIEIVWEAEADVSAAESLLSAFTMIFGDDIGGLPPDLTNPKPPRIN
jgi:hypothetical protein